MCWNTKPKAKKRDELVTTQSNLIFYSLSFIIWTKIEPLVILFELYYICFFVSCYGWLQNVFFLIVEGLTINYDFSVIWSVAESCLTGKHTTSYYFFYFGVFINI